MNDLSMGDAVTMRAGDGTSLGRIDQYELVRELGGGGFGCVYLARDTVAGIDVAVKGLPPLVRQNKEELENIRRNFALVSRLHDRHIAAALVLHPAKSVTYADRATAEKLRVFEGDFLVVMEYAPGVTLSQWRRQFPDGKVPAAQALEIVRQVAEALDYAHAEKIIHRDIKPANVMIETRVGEREEKVGGGGDGEIVVRVLDFGLAAEVRSSMGRVSQQVTDKSGTRPYMAPEQWLGKKQNAATDQYALAVLAYELLTGEVPFASVFETGDPVLMMNVVGREAPDLSSDLPGGMRKAFATALAKESPQRFASCRAFAEALTRGRARTPAAPLGWISAVLLVLALLGVGGYLWQHHEAERRPERLGETMPVAISEKPVVKPVDAIVPIVSKGKDESLPDAIGTIASTGGVGVATAFEDKSDAERLAAVKAEQDRQAEIARKKAMEEERLRQENEKRIAEEKAAQEAAKRKAEAAAEVERKRLADEERRKNELAQQKARQENARRRANGKEIERAFGENRWEDGMELSQSRAFEESGLICLGLGRVYSEGIGSIETDWRKAREYLEKAIDHYGVGGERDRELLEKAKRKDHDLDVIEAVRSGDLLRIKQYVNRETPCFDVFDVDDSLMHVAAQYADSSVLEYLLAIGYSVRQRVSSKSYSLPPFFRACANTNATKAVSCIEWFLSKGADVNECLDRKSFCGFAQYCPIGSAVTKEAFDLLVRRGAKTDFKSPGGMQLIHFLSVSEAEPAVLEAAINGGAAVDCRTEDGETPAMLCVRQIRHASAAARTLRTLIARGADLHVRDRDGAGLLHAACSHASRYYSATLEIVTVLIENGLDVNEAIPQVAGKSTFRTGFTPLHLAIKESDPALVELLVKHGADVSARDPDGCTPLMRAVEEDYRDGQDAIVESLLRHGARVDALKEGKYEQGLQAIHLFAQKNRRGRLLEAGRILQSLLGHGANIDAAVGPQSDYYKGYTPLMYAVREWDSFDGMMCKLLVGRGADLHMANAAGMNALHIAAVESTTNALSYLVGKGLSVDSEVAKGAEYHAGDTSLVLAVDRKKYDNARRLLELGASPRRTYYLGKKTPLMMAAEQSRADFLVRSGTGNAEKDRAENAQIIALMKLLILKGAYVNARDNSGKTALDYACLWRDGAEYLRSCGAKSGTEL